MFADVIVKQRTNVEELTYAIPASIIPYIQVGSVVVVPLRRRQVSAVVVGLRRRLPIALKKVVRPIAEIKRGVGFSAEQIAVIRQLAEYYGASLAEVAFHALNVPLLPIAKKETEINPLKPIFIEGGTKQRLNYYQKLVAANPGRSFVFVFALAAQAKAFFPLLPPGQQIILDDGRALATKKLAQLVENGQPFVLIANLGRIFTPLQKGDYLVIDQPDHLGTKQQQRPFMRAKTIAGVRAQWEGVAVIYGAVLPAVADIGRFSARQWQLVNLLTDFGPLTIVNRQGARDLLVPGMEAELIQRLAKKEKILVLVLSRGWAPAFICGECGHIFVCPRCARTASVAQTSLVCRHCSYQGALPSICPVCRSANLRTVGEGVSQAAQVIHQRFPGVSVQQISSDQPVFDPDAQLTIATEKIFSLPEAQFDTVVFLSTDRLLTGVEINQTWLLLSFLLTFAQAGSRILVETYFPDHPIWGLAGSGRIKDFFARELRARQKYRLPPYTALSRVVGQGRLLAELKEQTKVVQQQILKILPKAELSAKEPEAFGASGYRVTWQIFTPTPLSSKAKALLREALPPAWHLDIDY